MIFPDWNTATTKTAALPMAREWAVDFATGQLLLRDGEPYTVTGDEALKIWVYLALNAGCVRFLYTAHSHDYGNELGALFGRSMSRGIVESELKRRITDALAVCPYITGAEDFRFETQGGSVTAHFTVKTVYNSFETALETGGPA